MKKTHITLLAAILAAGIASPLFAGVPGKSSDLPTLKTEEQFGKLKAGDKIALVCKVDDSVKVINVDHPGETLQMVKDGASVHCKGCKKDYKVSHVGNPKNPTVQREIVIVDENGKPCMFFVKLH